MSSTPPGPPDAWAGAWPAVSVIVPVYGDRGQIRSTARALAEQDYPGAVEVLVVDNGNNHRLRESFACLPHVQLLTESVPGSYAARNRALDQAQGAVLAFTDGDCLPRADWLREGVTALGEQHSPAFVGGRLQLFARDPEKPTAAELWDCTNGLRQDLYVQEQGWAATANMITTRQTMDHVGPFNSALLSGGDRDWGLRAGAASVRPVYCDRAVVDHPARATLRELHTKIRRVTQGEVDRRRAHRSPVFNTQDWVARLRPNTRSIYRASARLPIDGWRHRWRYLLVAHWLQYYFVGSHVVLAGKAVLSARSPTTRNDDHAHGTLGGER